jgi:hypothetical protein
MLHGRAVEASPFISFPPSSVSTLREKAVPAEWNAPLVEE